MKRHRLFSSIAYGPNLISGTSCRSSLSGNGKERRYQSQKEVVLGPNQIRDLFLRLKCIRREKDNRKGRSGRGRGKERRERGHVEARSLSGSIDTQQALSFYRDHGVPNHIHKVFVTENSQLRSFAANWLSLVSVANPWHPAAGLYFSSRFSRAR
jgi:hypothetical protein